MKTFCWGRHATAYAVSVAVMTFKVIQSPWFLSHLKGLCDFVFLINSNLGPISHHLATIQSLPTDRRTDDNPAIDAYSI